MCLGDPGDVGETLLAGWGYVQGVVAPVVGVAVTLEQPVALEVVDERDELAGQQSEFCREGLLGAPRGRGDGPQQSGVRRGQVQLGKVLRKTQTRQSADLGEQERHLPPAGLLAGRSSLRH